MISNRKENKNSNKSFKLFLAARDGNQTEVERLLQDEAVLAAIDDVHFDSQHNGTALSQAVNHNHFEVVKTLLEHGAKVQPSLYSAYNLTYQDLFVNALFAYSCFWAYETPPANTQILKLLLEKNNELGFFNCHGFGVGGNSHILCNIFEFSTSLGIVFLKEHGNALLSLWLHEAIIRNDELTMEAILTIIKEKHLEKYGINYNVPITSETMRNYLGSRQLKDDLAIASKIGLKLLWERKIIDDITYHEIINVFDQHSQFSPNILVNPLSTSTQIPNNDLQSQIEMLSQQVKLYTDKVAILTDQNAELIKQNTLIQERLNKLELVSQPSGLKKVTSFF